MTQELIDRQGLMADDVSYSGSSLAALRASLFENPYCDPWPGVGEFQWPIYQVTLKSLLRGLLPGSRRYGFLDAAKRTIDSKADMRWGPDGLGVRRLLHPNGICLFGKWIIDQPSEYSGYFAEGSEGQLVTRYSTCCTRPSNQGTRSLSIVGKLFPTSDPEESQMMRPAGFITQEDLGGSRSQSIQDVALRNAPDTTFFRRGWDTPILVLTGLTFLVADREPAFRQLYEIAELGLTPAQKVRAPKFMQFVIEELPVDVKSAGLDFRDEIMAQLYDPGDAAPKRKLTMHIEVANEGKTTGPMLLQKRSIENWTRIGRLEFDSAVASYNGDFVIHFHHPAWRVDRDQPDTAIRQHGQRTRW